MPPDKDPTRVEAFLKWLQTHKLASFVVIFGICVIALGKFFTSLHEIIGFFHPEPAAPVTTSPVQPITTPPIPESPARPLSASVSPSPLPSAFSPPVTSIAFSPVTFAEIVRVESDNTLTDLQKDEFRRKHQGKIVEWTVRVFSVQRLFEHNADSDFSVVFGSADAPDIRSSHLGQTGVATFPASLRDDMVNLHSDEIIRFRGVLNFLDIGHPVSVRNCQLLEHHK